MSSFQIAVGVGALAFKAGVIGLNLQRLPPEHHTSERSRDMDQPDTGFFRLSPAGVLQTLDALKQ